MSFNICPSVEKIQITLTVEEAKEVISLGVMNHLSFLNSRQKGAILFKGGTTVSKITERLLDIPLRISGRITRRGTVSSLYPSKSPHSILLRGDSWQNIDDNITEIASKLTSEDLIITGANAIDVFGNAVMMAGSVGGGNPGQSLSTWYTEGVSVLIAVGSEKLIPGNLNDIIRRSGRTGKRVAWGMAVGLMPVIGEIFTEVEAIKRLAEVDAYIIGAGGIGEAQGSATIEITGSLSELDRLLKILEKIKQTESKVGGNQETLIECEAICENCQRHLACGYKKGIL